jgi:hypothetical protein
MRASFFARVHRLFLFSGDCGADVDVTLVQEEAVTSVLACELGVDAGFVFEEASVEFAGYAGVEGAGGAAEDVDVTFWHGWLVGDLRCVAERFERCGGTNSSESFASLRMTARTNNSKNKN